MCECCVCAASSRQEQPASHAPVGQIRGHRVWAEAQGFREAVLVLKGSVNVYMLVIAIWIKLLFYTETVYTEICQANSCFQVSVYLV